MTGNLQERVTDALSRIRNNRLGANVLEAEMIRDIATTTDGKVRLSLFLTPDDDATVVREVRQTLQQVPGVTDVRVDVKDASQANKPSTRVGATSRAAAGPLAAGARGDDRSDSRRRGTPRRIAGSRSPPRAQQSRPTRRRTRRGRDRGRRCESMRAPRARS